MDNFSGDKEVPSIKESTGKVGKETPGITRDNFLSVLNLEHAKLPDSFFVGESFLSGLDLLRQKTLEKQVEVGGVLFKDAKSEPKIHIIEPTPSNNSYFAGVEFHSLNENNIEAALKHQMEHLGEDFLKQRVYFVDSALAQKYRYFFENLIQDGQSVIVDGKPLAPIHSHSSDNLPSSGDFDHVLTGPSGAEDSSTASPEIVVTKDWAYFLIPTNQTPDLLIDSVTGKAIVGDFGRIIRQSDEEDVVVNHLMTISEKGNEEGSRNAVRLKNLKDKCLKYNVGFYTLAKGESVAKRIA